MINNLKMNRNEAIGNYMYRTPWGELHELTPKIFSDRLLAAGMAILHNLRNFNNANAEQRVEVKVGRETIRNWLK